MLKISNYLVCLQYTYRYSTSTAETELYQGQRRSRHALSTNNKNLLEGKCAYITLKIQAVQNKFGVDART